MSAISEVREIKKARKNHTCDWCYYDPINKGESYKTWFCFSEATTAKMHHECYGAMMKADLYDEELPTAGTYRRGCYCGENKEYCKCHTKERSELDEK